MPAIHEYTALGLARAISEGQLSAAEVLDHTLERAMRLGPRVGAFVNLTPDLARRHAQAADAALAKGGRLPPLLGVPCPVKDLTDVAGVVTSMGSAAFPAEPAAVDAGVVTRLLEAGTVMIGKTTTPELGLPCYTEPDIAAAARTPWDLTRSAGGSSGGAAAAVAAGIAPIAHGSDGGGSIRIPASACGLVGLKPSRGRISPGPHGVDGAALGSHGVLTRDVRDTAAALDILSVGWPGDTFLLPPPRTTFLDACDRPPPALRIGVLATPVIVEDATVHQACLDAVAATAALLGGLGHELDIAPAPFAAERWNSFQAIWAVVALSAPATGDAESLLVPLTRWLRDQGKAVTGLEYAEAIAGVQTITRETAQAWRDFDVILSPTLARPPARIGELREDADPAADFRAQCEFTPWTSIWNLTGWPAVNLPLHRADVDGTILPVGVMLGARLGQEETLLSLSAQLESAQPWHATHPPVW